MTTRRIPTDRDGTPTTLELAARVAEIEGARRAFITQGGQAALVLVYFACLSAGNHVLVPETVYGPSRAFADRILRRLGSRWSPTSPL